MLSVSVPQNSVAIFEAVEAADVEPPRSSTHTVPVGVDARSKAATADTFAVEEGHFWSSAFFSAFCFDESG